MNGLAGHFIRAQRDATEGVRPDAPVPPTQSTPFVAS